MFHVGAAPAAIPDPRGPAGAPMENVTPVEQAIAEAASLGADAMRLRAIVTEAAEARRGDRAWLRRALVYPAIVLVLALVGTVWITVRDGALIHDVEDAFREPPIPTPQPAWPRFGSGDVAVASLAALGAAGLLAWLVWQGRRDAAAGVVASRCDVLAELAAGGCTRDTGATLARAIVTDAAPVSAGWPPLVMHAIAHDDSDRRVSLLRSTAAFYRGLEQRRRHTLERVVPAAACCVAGLVVMLYGLALFRPLAGLVDTLAVPSDRVAREHGP